MRVVGLMRPFDFPHPEITIEALAEQVDGIYYFCDKKVSPNSLSYIDAHPSTLGVVVNEKGWKNGETLHESFKWVLRIEQPDYIFYPDEDEIIPKSREWIIDRMETANVDTNLVMAFRFINCFENQDTIIVGWIDAAHGKVMKIVDPPIKFMQETTKGYEYLGCCVPHNAIRIISEYPLRHLTVMTEKCRKRRLSHTKCRHAHGDFPVDYSPKNILPYNPKATTDDYRILFSSFPSVNGFP